MWVEAFEEIQRYTRSCDHGNLRSSPVDNGAQFHIWLQVLGSEYTKVEG